MVLFRIRGSIGSIGFASLKWPICPDVIDVSRIYMDLSCFIPICPEWCRCSLRQIAAQPLFCPVHWRELLTQPLRWRDDQKRPQRCLGLRKKHDYVPLHYMQVGRRMCRAHTHLWALFRVCVCVCLCLCVCVCAFVFVCVTIGWRTHAHAHTQRPPTLQENSFLADNPSQSKCGAFLKPSRCVWRLLLSKSLQSPAFLSVS